MIVEPTRTFSSCRRLISNHFLQGATTAWFMRGRKLLCQSRIDSSAAGRRPIHLSGAWFPAADMYTVIRWSLIALHCCDPDVTDITSEVFSHPNNGFRVIIVVNRVETRQCVYSAIPLHHSFSRRRASCECPQSNHARIYTALNSLRGFQRARDPLVCLSRASCVKCCIKYMIFLSKEKNRTTANDNRRCVKPLTDVHFR